MEKVNKAYVMKRPSNRATLYHATIAAGRFLAWLPDSWNLSWRVGIAGSLGHWIVWGGANPDMPLYCQGISEAELPNPWRSEPLEELASCRSIPLWPGGQFSTIALEPLRRALHKDVR